MSPERQCVQDQCEVSSAGNCLEGFLPAAACPYRRGERSAADPQSKQPLFIDLPSGLALSPIEANNIARDVHARVILLAGDHESGKTTLLTSIYESFQEASFAGFSFAGSQTLLGWEERCHDGRLSSGRSVPHTEHTKVGDGLKFLHLKLSEMRTSNVSDLLLADVSGELFRRLRDSAAAIDSFQALRRVDVLCAVMDGERIVKAEERFVARNNVRALLRSLKDANVLQGRCHTSVVVSKWDAIVASPDVEEISGFVQESFALYEREFPGVTFSSVAARPRAKLSFAHGVATLLRNWCQDSPSSPSPVDVRSLFTGLRHFERFGTVGV